MLVHIIVKSSICWTQLTRNFISTHLTTLPWGSVTETFLSVFLLNKRTFCFCIILLLDCFASPVILVNICHAGSSGIADGWNLVKFRNRDWEFRAEAYFYNFLFLFWWNSGPGTERLEQRNNVAHWSFTTAHQYNLGLWNVKKYKAKKIKEWKRQQKKAETQYLKQLWWRGKNPCSKRRWR